MWILKPVVGIFGLWYVHMSCKVLSTLYLPIGAVASWLVRSFPEQRSVSKPWLGTLCCVLGQDTFSQSASLHPGV